MWHWSLFNDIPLHEPLLQARPRAIPIRKWQTFIGLAIMSYKPLYHALQIWQADAWLEVFFFLSYSSTRGFIKFFCKRSVGFFSRAFLVFLMKENKKRRRKQPGKLMAKSHSQPVNLPGAPWSTHACWIKDDYNQLSCWLSTVPSYIQQTLVE